MFCHIRKTEKGKMERKILHSHCNCVNKLGILASFNGIITELISCLTLLSKAITNTLKHHSYELGPLWIWFLKRTVIYATEKIKIKAHS